jgi:hypothetical protein
MTMTHRQKDTVGSISVIHHVTKLVAATLFL